MGESANEGEWLGWHFLAGDGRLRHGDGRKPEVGVPLRFEGEPELCVRGLHACRRAIDALGRAPGPIVCRVALADGLIDVGGKAVAREWTVIAMADATAVLHEFAMWAAEQVLPTLGGEAERLYREAYAVKRAWLRGDAAWEQVAAAKAAAGAAGFAARDAGDAESAADATAWSAAWSARDAGDAESTAWSAAWAARYAGAAAAWAAANAARSAAGDDAWSAQERELAARLTALLGLACDAITTTERRVG